MDLALLRTFVTVHRAGSFTRAAALLGSPSPRSPARYAVWNGSWAAPVPPQGRGVTPTTMGDELAHKVAPHLDALLEITEADAEGDAARHTLHLAGRRSSPRCAPCPRWRR
ncbi:hypothetical protein NKH77_26460 [Streptomyces sp. M19]